MNVLYSFGMIRVQISCIACVLRLGSEHQCLPVFYHSKLPRARREYMLHFRRASSHQQPEWIPGTHLGFSRLRAGYIGSRAWFYFYFRMRFWDQVGGASRAHIWMGDDREIRWNAALDENAHQCFYSGVARRETSSHHYLLYKICKDGSNIYYCIASAFTKNI